MSLPRSDLSSQDIAIQGDLNESVSALAFSPTSDILAVGGWDHQVRLYEIGQDITGKAAFAHGGPILDVCWSSDGCKVFSAGADHTAGVVDVQTGTASQIGVHQEPIRSVRWTSLHGGLLVTASWDKTLKVRVTLYLRTICCRRPKL